MDMKLFGKKVNVEGLIAILILLFVIFVFTNSYGMMSKEGFDNNKLTEDGAPIGYYGQQDLPNSWINKELTLNGNKGYNQILGLHKELREQKCPLNQVTCSFLEIILFLLSALEVNIVRQWAMHAQVLIN